MKLVLSNLFSVMAASSFVSSANALGLDDYSAMTIGARDPLPANDAIVVANDVIANACKIGDAGNGVVAANDQLLRCGFAYSTSKTDGSTLAGSTIIAEILEGACATVAAAAVAIPETVNGEFISTGTGATTSVIPEIAMEFTSAEKNGVGEAVEKTTEAGVTKTVITQSYCARADVWDNVDKASGSVLAYMMQVETKTTFDNNGDFSTTVSTTEFDAKAAAAAATRTIPVFAKVGACTDGANSAALKELVQGNAIAIGAVLDICVFVDYDEDSDVRIAKVKSVVIKDGETTITTPVDGDGAPNFVTTAEQDANAVTISTLMIPKIYDTLTLTDGAGSFTISGVAELTYIAGTRHLSSGERRLQSEEAPFSLEVDLTKNDLPQVAMNEEESGAMSAGVGMMALAAGVAALL